MKFVKMNGAGNDFIIINNMDQSIPKEKYSILAKILCERHLSIGADGMMIVTPPEEGGDYKMNFYNSDGSLGEMCGNGARCIARYGYDNGLAGDVQRIETTAGLVTGKRITKREYRVRLNDVTKFEDKVIVKALGMEYEASYVELGNPPLPHCVVNIPNLKEYDKELLKKIGREIRFAPEFSKGANVNFYDIVGEDEIYEYTFERGVEDFTYACGTGTGSMVYSLFKRGFVSGKKVKVHVPGGLLIIDIDDGIYLTGPTNVVCVGEITDEELLGEY